jgi:hydrogenase/urease accessory protein HupE
MGTQVPSVRTLAVPSPFIAGGGLVAGFLHPLSGSDHLLLLLALVGAIGGGLFGALGGTLPEAFRHRRLGYVDALAMVQALVKMGGAMKVVPLRLSPGEDPRLILEAWMGEQQEQAAV